MEVLASFTKCILSPRGFCREEEEEGRMGRDKWKAGDLVQVTMHERLGWGDRSESYLVLVLGLNTSQRTQT